MQAFVRGLQNGGSILPRVLPVMSSAVAARIVSTTSAAGAPATEAVPSASGAALSREFQVYRWHPEEGGKPRYQSYNVDLNR